MLQPGELNSCQADSDLELAVVGMWRNGDEGVAQGHACASVAFNNL